MTSLQNQMQKLPPRRAMIGAIAYDLTRFSLPLLRIEEPFWTRRNGGTTFTVTGATMQNPDGTSYIEVPSGKYARAALFYLCTWGRIVGEREIPLGGSYRSFLQLVGLPWAGTAAAREAIRQLELVAGSTFSVHAAEVLEEEGQSITYRSSERVQLADETHFWLPTTLEDRMIKNSRVVLSAAFHEALTHATPVPTPAWKHLMAKSHSALPLDIYLWLCARLYQIKQDSRISWTQLHAQFGSTAPLKSFKRTFRAALELVMEVYPEARIYEQHPASQRRGFSGYLLKPGSGSAVSSQFMSVPDPAGLLTAPAPEPLPNREEMQ